MPLEVKIKKPIIVFLWLALVCSPFLNTASAGTAASVSAAEKDSAAALQKVDGESSDFVEQEGPVFEEDKPRRGAPLVVAAAVVLVVAAVYFLAIKKPKTVETILQVNSLPDNAVITLNGRNTGKLTPHQFSNMTPGYHSVKLTRDGYEIHYSNVQVLKGRTTVVDAVLTKSF